MQNLTTWCNLFSTASKFNLTVYPSRYQKLVKQAVLVFVSGHIIALLTPSIPAMVNVYLMVLLSLFLYLSIKSHLISNTLHTFQQVQSSRYCFVLGQNGDAVFTNQASDSINDQLHYQLHASSRKGLWGCRLNFVEASKKSHAPILLWDDMHADDKTINNTQKKSRSKVHNKVIKSVYIYKDSVSSQDYCRICRVLYAVKAANR